MWKAIEDAGYTPNELAQAKTGLFVGVSSNDYGKLLGESTSAYAPTGNAHSVLVNRVSYLLNLRGPSVATDTACSSALVALHQAIKAIEDGDCETAIVGGVNAMITPTLHIAFNQAGMLSRRWPLQNL